MEPQKLLSIDETARRLGLRPVTIRSWAGKRKIARVKLGRRVLIPSSEVDRLIERSTIPALPERHGR
ncbi:MAG: helix-turn-helix domain-containing protein [Beijerinckiaceae bacterium]|jgi:excisionase family DNA binding protein